MNKRIFGLEFEFSNLRSPNLSLALHRPALVLSVVLAFSSCERERRDFRGSSPGTVPAGEVRQSALRPGMPAVSQEAKIPEEENAYALSEGKRLYEWFNCTGCHAQGGGDIGPPLMDDEWIYGSNPENIFASVIEGRPNGMPSFADKIPANEVWQIVAYVRSLSGQVSKDAAPSRSDHMQSKAPEQSKEKEQPKPGRAEHKQ